MWGNISSLPYVRPDQDYTRSLGTSPDWESNPQPFGVQDDAPTNWANQPRCQFINI